MDSLIVDHDKVSFKYISPVKKQKG